MGNLIKRQATIDDIDSLVAIEEACFDSDRISRRSFRSIYKKHGIASSVFLKKLKYGLFMRKKTLIWTVLRLKG